MKHIKLGELIDISKGRKACQLYNEPAPEAKRYIQINDLRTDDKTVFAVDPSGIEVNPADICIAWDGANAGTVGYGLSGFIGSTIARLRPVKEEIFYTPYVGRFLQSKFHHFNDGTTGATIPHISKGKLVNELIPLPPLDEQRRIAAILDKADAIRRKRQESIRLTEEFLHSTFLDMFGDPVTNPKGWTNSVLENVSDIQSGITKGRKLNGQTTISVPYMRVANVQDGHINLSEIKEIEATPAEVKRFKLVSGDIILTEGGDPDKLGRGAVWNGQINPCIHQNHIFRIRTNTEFILPEYLSALIGSAHGKNYFLKAAKQTTGIATINKTQLSNFPILLPPIILQKQFAKLIINREAIQQKYAANQVHLLEFFDAIAQRAFQGGLS